MSGGSSYSSIGEIAAGLDSMTSLAEVERALGEVEYYFEQMPPDMQGPIERLMDRLLAKRAQLGRR